MDASIQLIQIQIIEVQMEKKHRTLNGNWGYVGIHIYIYR